MKIIFLLIIFFSAYPISAQEIHVGMNMQQVTVAFGNLPLHESNSTPSRRQFFAPYAIFAAIRGSALVYFDTTGNVSQYSWMSDHEQAQVTLSGFEGAIIYMKAMVGSGKNISKTNDKEEWKWKKGNVSYSLSKDFRDILDRKIIYTEMLNQSKVKKK